MNSPVPIPAILDAIRTRKDGTLLVTFETSELHVQDKVYLMECANKQGFLYFSVNPFKEIVIPDIQLGDLETKKPSQRLRNSLYRLWEQGDKADDFDAFYKKQMEKIIDFVKDKLN